eukprot:370749_1
MGALFGKRTNRRSEDEEKRARTQSLEEKADGMQMVLPNIYMGSAKAAKNLELLKSVGVTHILAIGWNLQKHFESEFKYLLLNKIEDRPSYFIMRVMSECFTFMDECIVENKAKLFVHCHKGLSRSATVIIGYEMYLHKKPFNSVLKSIRENRSFIMPNIGFQAQLKHFEVTNYSLNFDKDWTGFNVLNEIKKMIPSIKHSVGEYYKMYQENDIKHINDKDLFAKTMYIHQVHKLREKGKLDKNDINELNDAINYLRKIQIEFICDAASINRFNVMFKSKYDHDKQQQQQQQ